MTAQEAEAPPKLWEHCLRVFERMRQSAVPQTLKDGTEDRHALIWEGHLTRLFRELNLPNPYYTSVMSRLKVMGCVRQLSRGGGSAPSKWELIDDPEYAKFDKLERRKQRKHSRLGIAESRIGDVNRRVDGIDDRVATLERAAGLRSDDA